MGTLIFNPDLWKQGDSPFVWNKPFVVAAYIKHMEVRSICSLSTGPCSPWHVHFFTGIRVCFFGSQLYNEDQLRLTTSRTEQLLDSWAFCGQLLLDQFDYSLYTLINLLYTQRDSFFQFSSFRRTLINANYFYRLVKCLKKQSKVSQYKIYMVLVAIFVFPKCDYSWIQKRRRF